MQKRSLAGLRMDHKPRLSQERIAVLIAAQLKRSFSPARYWQIENGYRTPPTADEKKAVATVLGVRVSDIDWPQVQKAMAS